MKKLMNIALESAEESSVSLDESMGDILVDIVETGPLSKDEITGGLDELLEKKLVTMVASKGELRVAATPEGAKVYRRIVDPEDTLSDKTIDTIIYERVKLRNESSEGNPATEGIFDTLKRAVGGGSSVSMSDIRDGKAAVEKIKATFLDDTWLEKHPFKPRQVVISKHHPTLVNNSSDFGYSQLKSTLEEFSDNAKAKIKGLEQSLAPFEKAIMDGSMADEPERWSYRLDDAEIDSAIRNIDGLMPWSSKNGKFQSLTREQTKKAAELVLRILTTDPAPPSNLQRQLRAIQIEWDLEDSGDLLSKFKKQLKQKYGSDDEQVRFGERIIDDLTQIIREAEINLPSEDYLVNFMKIETDRFVYDLINYMNESSR